MIRATIIAGAVPNPDPVAVTVPAPTMSPSHRAGTFCGRQVQSMAIRGGNTSSYDTQEQPFRPDNLRGRWAKSIDFYFASSTYAFSTMAFSDVSAWALIMGGWSKYNPVQYPI